MHKILPLDSPNVASSGGPAPGLGSSGRRWVTALCAALVTLGLTQVAGAAPGDLDPSFDADGRVLTDIGGIDGDAPGESDFFPLVVVQPDGKLVVAGTSFVAGGNSVNVALARYNADGSLDASFGSGGRVLTDFQGKIVDSASIEPDGKILISGSNSNFSVSDSPIGAFLGRYDPDGSLDDSFGSGGRLLIEVSSILSGLGNFNTYLQPDGKLLVAGDRREPLPDGEFGEADLALARFNADGSLDASFGSGGRVITDDNRGESFGTLIRQPDGKLVVAGSSLDFEVLREEFALTRYNPDGSLDASFGSGGRVFTDVDGRIETDPSTTFFLSDTTRSVYLDRGGNSQVFPHTFQLRWERRCELRSRRPCCRQRLRRIF